MRLVHTSDWHLGRTFIDASLIDDQRYVLEQLIDIVKDTKPQALVIAGDIYDRPIPPADAVDLLDEVLTKLILDLKTTVVIIAGNHDHPLRIEFGARIMENLLLHIHGNPDESRVSLRIPDDWGYVSLFAMPFMVPEKVREHLKEPMVTDQETASKAWINLIRANQSQSERSVLIGHAFVAGGETSESERHWIGGAETVPPECFEGFDYVALGHLHRSQFVSDERLNYSGSILKYSFSEATQTKSVSLVELDESGNCSITRCPLRPRRDVRCIEGTFSDLLHKAQEYPQRGDYIQVKLLDRGPILNARGRLKEVYPNLLEVDPVGLISLATESSQKTNDRAMSPTAMFASFYKDATGETLTDEQMSEFRSIIERVDQDEREAS